MRNRSLTIGTGLGSDLQFQSLPKCSRLSSRHAAIYYDEVNQLGFSKHFTLIYVSVSIIILQVTKVYELLNYSEFGTEINGQLYSCDFTEYPELSEHRIEDVNGFYENIRSIIDEKRNVKRIEYKLDENAT